jgi:SAM-dependent methyltransferase
MPEPGYLDQAGRFATRLLEEAPASVLDVGCGAGFVIGRCHEAGVPAIGIDPSATRLADGAAIGYRVVRGAAAPLPFAAGAFDWVALRHVLHHVPDVRAALAEAVRVARTGAAIAEPWYDVTFPAQAVALRAHRWKLRRRAHGGPVAPALRPADLLALLPEGAVGTYAYEHAYRPWPVPLEHFVADAEPLLRDCAPDDPDRREYEAICAGFRHDGCTDCGTAILVVRWRRT